MNDSNNNAEDSITGALVNITLAATQELKRIAAEDKQPHRVRLAMLGGGCSGYKADMNFTKWPQDEEFDLTFTEDGIEFLIDKKSATLLNVASLDYGVGLLDKGFQWSFSNSTGGCGCGISFAF